MSASITHSTIATHSQTVSGATEKAGPGQGHHHHHQFGAPVARRHTSEPVLEHTPHAGKRMGWFRSIGHKFSGQSHSFSSSSNLPLNTNTSSGSDTGRRNSDLRKMSVDSACSTPTLVNRAESHSLMSSSDESTCMGDDDQVVSPTTDKRRFRQFSFGRSDAESTTTVSPTLEDDEPAFKNPASPHSSATNIASPATAQNTKPSCPNTARTPINGQHTTAEVADLPKLSLFRTTSRERKSRSASFNGLRRISTNPGTVSSKSAGALTSPPPQTQQQSQYQSQCPISAHASCLRQAVTGAVSSAHEYLFGTACSDKKIDELQKLTKKRVMFAKEVYMHDPPQQIPPMHPRTGNVEFVGEGELNLSLANRPRDCDFPPYLERNHGELTKCAQQRAHDQASRLHSSLSRHQFSLFSRFGCEQEHDEATAVSGDDNKSGLGVGDVDGKVHAHELGTEEAEQHVHELEVETEEAADVEKHEPTPDMIYTRCCHLREILPIKSMLKQLKDQSIPVSSLYVANAKPTIIEILALSDLLAVVPVSWVSLDNTVLTTEMLSLILSSLSLCKGAHRLTLCNMQMDDLAWKHLSLFVSSQPGLVSLDVSCDSTKTRVPSFSRKDVNWRLLARAIKAHGELMHLSVSETGISGSDLESLVSATNSLAAIETANNNLTRNDIEMLYRYASTPGYMLECVNISGNDLSQMWDMFVKFLLLPRVCKLIVANTGLKPTPGAEAPLTVDNARNTRLLVFDIGGNKDLGEKFLSNLVEVMPHFSHLTRLDLSGCKLSDEFIVNLSEAVVNCRKLIFLGLREDEPLNETAAAALCVAAKMSRSLCNVEINKVQISCQYAGKITKYTLRNLEKAANHSASTASASSTTSSSGQAFKDGDRPPESPAAVIAANAVANAREESSTAHTEAIVSFQRDFKKLTADVVNAESSSERCTPEARQEMVAHVEALRTRLRRTLQELLSWKVRNPHKITIEQREEFIWLYFCEGTLNRLLWQLQTPPGQSHGIPSADKMLGPQGASMCTRPGDTCETGSDEVVSVLGQSTGALSRRSSTTSLKGLKELDQAEGESHKRNTKLQADLMGDDTERPQFEKLHCSFLERIMS